LSPAIKEWHQHLYTLKKFIPTLNLLFPKVPMVQLKGSACESKKISKEKSNDP